MDRDIKPENMSVDERRETIDLFVDELEVRRRRGMLRLVPKPLAYCRPANDQGRR